MAAGGDDHADAPAGTQAVQRALAVLDCFRRGTRSLTLSEIAREVGLNVSTAHRLVRALCHAGFMEQETTSERYRLGIAIAVLGQRAMEQSGYALAQPVLARLSVATGESATLGLRRGDEVVVVETANSPQPLRFDHRTGAEIQLHASAMGKVLLAFGGVAPKDAVAVLPRLTRYTGHTLTTRAALVAELTAVRSQGYAVNGEERYDGVSGIAAPVLAPNGIAHAAVGVQGPSMRLTAARLDEIASLVRAAADEVASLVVRV